MDKINTPALGKEAIVHFKQIYLKHFGQELSNEEASFKATEFMLFFMALGNAKRSKLKRSIENDNK